MTDLDVRVRALRAIRDTRHEPLGTLLTPTDAERILVAIEAAGLVVVDRERLARLEADAAAWQSHRAAALAVWGKDGSMRDD